MADYALIYLKDIDVNAKMVFQDRFFYWISNSKRFTKTLTTLAGYSGINCQEEKSDCRNDTCPQRAMCKDEPGLGNFTCLCRSGYTGENCDMTVITWLLNLKKLICTFSTELNYWKKLLKQVNPCTANGNPCKNEAKCIALKQGRYKCDCPPGWEGQHCEENIGNVNYTHLFWSTLWIWHLNSFK